MNLNAIFLDKLDQYYCKRNGRKEKDIDISKVVKDVMDGINKEKEVEEENTDFLL